MDGKNEIEFGDGFLRDVKRLPKEVVRKLGFLVEYLREDAFDPRLHAKPLGTPLADKYSFRITRDWRVGFMFTGISRIKLMLADHRSKFYERMKRF